LRKVLLPAGGQLRLAEWVRLVRLKELVKLLVVSVPFHAVELVARLLVELELADEPKVGAPLNERGNFEQTEPELDCQDLAARVWIWGREDSSGLLFSSPLGQVQSSNCSMGRRLMSPCLFYRRPERALARSVQSSRYCHCLNINELARALFKHLRQTQRSQLDLPPATSEATPFISARFKLIIKSVPPVWPPASERALGQPAGRPAGASGRR